MEWDIECHLPAGVAERLGYYVYLYVDPRTDEPFYVGKGVGDRVLAHFGDVRDSSKTRLIAELRSAGIPPRLEILAHGLKDQETAFRVEAAVIDVLGLDSLTNEVRGWRSLQMGRMTLDELVGVYAAKPVAIDEPVLLVRINKLYRLGMSDLELYEATRGIWKLGPRRECVRFALAVFHGLVREVYEVRSWHPAGTIPYETRDLFEPVAAGPPSGTLEPEPAEGKAGVLLWDGEFEDRMHHVAVPRRDISNRWEFDGVVAAADIRAKYNHKSVHEYLTPGNQSPTVYVNV